jgi:hypothetical protein
VIPLGLSATNSCAVTGHSAAVMSSSRWQVVRLPSVHAICTYFGILPLFVLTIILEIDSTRTADPRRHRKNSITS